MKQTDVNGQVVALRELKHGDFFLHQNNVCKVVESQTLTMPKFIQSCMLNQSQNWHCLQLISAGTMVQPIIVTEILYYKVQNEG